MLLGGLWHGAGWTFILWGGLHGMYLVTNHAWHYIQQRLKLEGLNQLSLWRVFSWFLTFVSVVNGWVFFRAENFDAALVILRGMYGFDGVALPNAITARLGGLSSIISDLGITTFIGGGSQFIFTYLWLALLMFIAFTLPNTQQIMDSLHKEESEQGDALFNQGLFHNTLKFRYSMGWAFIMSGALVIAIFGMTRVSEFLYFQF